MNERSDVTRDPLTGVESRTALEAWLSEARGDEQTVVMILDLDHFKSINDQLSHAAGDAVLAAVGTSLRRLVERYTAARAFRYGGGGVVVGMSGYTLAEGIGLARATIDAVAGIEVQHVDRLISVSIGLTSSDLSTKDQMLRDADHALFEAKQRGRHRIQVFAATTSTVPLAQRLVLHPSLFEALGKTLRLAFVQVSSLEAVSKAIRSHQPSMECLSVLGSVDLILAHLSDRDARFLADIQVILSSEETDDQRPNRYFVVTRTLKYHGYAINQIAIPRTPDRETLTSLVDGAEGRLSPDHPGIQQWIAAGFVLGVESDDSRDQEIEAYVLVDLLRARDDIGSQLFDLIAREDLLSDPHVLSIYEGYGVQKNTQFVLRLRAIPQDLFAFVEHFHRRCDQAFLRAQTNTYIVASRITDHLYHTLLMPPLNEVDKNIRDVLIVPELSPDEQAEFLYQPAEAQTATIQSVAQIDRTFATLELPGEMAAPKDLRSLRRQVIRAVATSNSAELRHAYLDLWALIEPPLRDC